MRLLCLLPSLLLLACDPRPAPPPGMRVIFESATDEATWAAAEARAREQLSGRAITSIRRRRALPCFLEVQLAGGERDLLVFGGRVVPEKTGLDGLAAYLRDSGFLQRPSVDADSFLRLAFYFDTFPPASQSSGFHALDGAGHPELRPKLAWDEHGARFVLNYVLPSATPPGLSRGYSDRLPIEEWTLLIPFTYDLAWQRRTFEIDR